MGATGRPATAARPPVCRDDLGRRGFAANADRYQRSRPGYPPALIRRLVDQARLGPASVVVDLASGTGALTRQLHQAGLPCVAVEPSAAMRQQARSARPASALVGGAAEAVPLVDQCADMVTVAQAFHWFDPERAFDEIWRVLRPGGAMFAVWNERDSRVPWVAELGRRMTAAGGVRHPPADAFGELVRRHPRFCRVKRWEERFVTTLDVPTLVDLVASRSYVNVLEEPARRQVLDDVRALAESLPQPIGLPYVTVAFLARAAAP